MGDPRTPEDWRPGGWAMDPREREARRAAAILIPLLMVITLLALALLTWG